MASGFRAKGDRFEPRRPVQRVPLPRDRQDGSILTEGDGTVLESTWDGKSSLTPTWPARCGGDARVFGKLHAVSR